MTYNFASGSIPKASYKRHSILTPDMTKERVCVLCNKKYQECRNIGCWQCHMHTLPFDRQHGYFLCCQRADHGCVECDHQEKGDMPYPNSVSQQSITAGLMAYRIKRDDLQEICPVERQDSIIIPPDDAEHLYILRRSFFSR